MLLYQTVHINESGTSPIGLVLQEFAFLGHYLNNHIVPVELTCADRFITTSSIFLGHIFVSRTGVLFTDPSKHTRATVAFVVSMEIELRRSSAPSIE
jgi:hypothetical protein